MITKEPTVMILAAGLGTRLRPYTDVKPKALIEFRKKPMIEHVIENILRNDFKRLVVNVHHHAEQLIDFLHGYIPEDVELLISDERDLLMDTGGAIIKAREYLEGHGPFVVYNTDIFSDIDLRKMYNYHVQKNVLATLAAKKRNTSRNLLFDTNGNLSGWKNNRTGESITVDGKEPVKSLAFSGIHVLDPEIFRLIENDKPFSIIKSYLDLASEERIILYDHSDDEWIDMAGKHLHSESP